MAELDWKVGFQLHGFTVTGNDPLPEINARLIRLRHDVTGARMAHLATEDDNNMFGVGFQTTPRDSTGVAHILEHTALCGSRRYPVRDPFFSMIKRSLNTFMNALTSSDWTLYPFSTQNEKDFNNLMGIYLDAAFFPLLRERDFRQEGHRLEFAEPENPDSPLTFKGVVYNEMKGAMADPSSLLNRRLTGALYPATTYGYNSGGEPSAIPDLTWEALREFHATYYHPANSYIYTYGNFPLENHLKSIEELALSHFESFDLRNEVPDEVRYAQPKSLTESFPVDPEESTSGKSMVQVGWLTCNVADSLDRTALGLLSTLLLGDPAAPLYQTLIESGLGGNLAPGTGYHDENRETYFAAGLQGTEPDAAGRIEKLILDTLEKCAHDGFSPDRIESAIHQMEFAHREVTGDHYPYPLALLFRMLGPWIHNEDPLTPLFLDRDLKEIRRRTAVEPFFQDLIRKYLLDNTHRVTLLLKPDPEQNRREEAKTAARLQEISSRLSDEDRKNIVRQARELQVSQETPEDLSVLPTLQISDIPPEERNVPFRREDHETLPVYWLEQPTNGIGYFSVMLDGGNVPEDLMPYVPLFCSLLTQIGAAGKTYLEMAERIAAATGGLRAGISILDDPGSLDNFRAFIEIKGKALLRNQAPMFDILRDIFTAPDFTDLKRLHTVSNQIRVALENSIPGSGHSYASRSAGSALTPAGRFREKWAGLEQIRFIKQIAARSPEDFGDIAEKMGQLARILFNANHLRCAMTAEKKAMAEIASPLSSFLDNLPREGAPRKPEGTASVSDRHLTGWALSVPVSYVARAFRTVPFTHPDAAGLMVLSKLLRANFLHREIREKGGAYGGMAAADPEAGIFSMLSYRDPNLTRTLNVYRDAVGWAVSGHFDDEAIKEAILASFATLDRSLSPGGRGEREFANQVQGLTPEMRREFRERVLGTNREVLVSVAEKYLREGWDQSAASVVSSEELLKKANEELQEEKLEIEKI